MLFFTLEIVLSSIAIDNYFLSFFFWLDVVGTLSLVGDIGWIVDNITNAQENTTDLAKTSRAARVTRIIRVVRLVRLVRIVKLYKQAKTVQKKNEEKQQQELESKIRLMRIGTFQNGVFMSFSPASLAAKGKSVQVVPTQGDLGASMRRMGTMSGSRQLLIGGG